MAIVKKYLKSKPICKVTFQVEAPEANEMALVGEFNEWTKTPLKRLKSGTFKTTVAIETNAQYEFRYLKDGEYINDNQADAYQFNAFAGAENSVVII